MRGFWLGLVLCMAVLFPKIGNAQVYQFRTPPPDVSAAGALWQINSVPIVVGGLTYYPTRGIRFFDGQVMAQIGNYENVPVYADMTLEPYSELYVPVGNSQLRAYERRRDRELAGTTGSHVPAFPAESPSAAASRERTAGTSGSYGTAGSYATAGSYGAAADRSVATERAVGTAGSSVPMPAMGSAVLPDRARARRTSIETIMRPSGSNGVWVEFNGARWYSDGPATSFSPDRFEPVGQYRGFPVYQDMNNPKGEIWVSVVKDGPLAPYVKR
jgi:hypothetical protein